MKTKRYPSDLTDHQWEITKNYVPAPASRGRRRTLDMREVINAIFYVVVGGVQWRMLPRDFPCWQSVYFYFGRWRDDGTWKRIHDALRAQVRLKKWQTQAPNRRFSGFAEREDRQHGGRARLRWRQTHQRPQTPYFG